jgi:hypothetical protein
MKKVFFVLFLLISFTEICAQKYSPTLDETDVISSFKFGKQKDLFTNLQYSMVFKAKSEIELDKFVYKYLGNNPNELFSVYWDTVYLMFSRGVLVDFEINWKNPNGFEQVSKNLKSIFGDTVIIRLSDSKFYYSWRSDNIEMSLIKQEQTNNTDGVFTLRIRNDGLIRELSKK